MFDKHYEVLETKPCQAFLVGPSLELSIVVDDNGIGKAISAYKMFLSEFFHLAS